MSFEQFFSTGFGKDLSPYDYQHALAKQAWPDALIAPTGLGKTDVSCCLLSALEYTRRAYG